MAQSVKHLPTTALCHFLSNKKIKSSNKNKNGEMSKIREVPGHVRYGER